MRRPQLALVPAYGLGHRLRPPSRRTLAVAAGVLAALALAYVAARETPLFALRELEVAGAPPAVRQDVEAALRPVLGESLVTLDAGEARRLLEELPTVRSASVDRAFPHALRVAVVPERPLALLRRGPAAWVLSARGRVLGQAETRPGERLPAVRVPAPTPVEVGGMVEVETVRRALGILRRLPEGFPVGVRSVRATPATATLVLRGGAEVRLGRPAGAALKLEVAGRVLRTLSSEERAELAYLDVTLPERPVAALNSQVST